MNYPETRSLQCAIFTAILSAVFLQSCTHNAESDSSSAMPKPKESVNLIPDTVWNGENPLKSWKITGPASGISFETTPGGDKYLLARILPKDRLVFESDYIPIDPAQKFKISYCYKTEDMKPEWSRVFVDYYKMGAHLGSQEFSFRANQNEWRKIVYPLIVPNGTEAAKLRIRLMEAGNISISGISVGNIDEAEFKRITPLGKLDISLKTSGDTPPPITPEGKYSLKKRDGAWRLFDPSGNAFWNISLWGASPISGVGENPLRKHIRRTYIDTGRTEEYYDKVFDRLISHGFNSIGSGIETQPMNKALEQRKRNGKPTLPYVDTIHGGERVWENARRMFGEIKVQDIAMVDINNNVVRGCDAPFGDVFSEKFRAAYDEYVKQFFQENRNPELFAVCLDNEMPWHEMKRTIYSPACRKEFARWTKKKYGGSIKAYNLENGGKYESFEEIESQMPVWNETNRNTITGFCRHFAREYITFQIKTVKKYNPDVLIIGQRLSFCGYGPDSADSTKNTHEWFMDLLCAYDIVGLNVYPQAQDHFSDDQMETIEWVHRKTGRPIIITEWCVCCNESQAPTIAMPYLWTTVPTWEDRARGYRNCMAQLANLPYVVGAHWFAQYNNYRHPDPNNGNIMPMCNWGFYENDWEADPLFLEAAIETNKAILSGAP